MSNRRPDHIDRTDGSPGDPAGQLGRSRRRGWLRQASLMAAALLVIVIVTGVLISVFDGLPRNIDPTSPSAAGPISPTEPTKAAETPERSTVATVSSPSAPVLPENADLSSSDAASAAAMRWAKTIFEAREARVVTADLLLVRDAREAQRLAAGRAMLVWDPATYDEPVWVVALTGSSFRFHDCPDCPTGTRLLLTIRASDDGMYWAAIGADGMTGMTQVIPHRPLDNRITAEVTPEEMGRAALDYPRSWVSARQRDVEPESGQPEVVVSKPATRSALQELGLGDTFAPSCQRPLYVVVLHGDFAGDVQYIGYVFDLGDGPPGQVMLTAASQTDEPFRHTLGGPPPSPSPSLASPEATRDTSAWPCETIWLPGAASVPPATPADDDLVVDAGAWQLVVARGESRSVAAVIYGETIDAAIMYANAVRQIGDAPFASHETIPVLVTFMHPIAPEHFAALMIDSGARVRTYRIRTRDDGAAGTMQLEAGADGVMRPLPDGGWVSKDGMPRHVVGVFDAEVLIDVNAYHVLAGNPNVFLIDVMRAVATDTLTERGIDEFAMDSIVINPPFWLLEQAGTTARSTQARLTAEDSGRRFDYVVTGRFEIVLDQEQYPRENLAVSCDPSDTIGAISNLPSLERPADWAARYTGVVPDICTITNNDFSVQIVIVPLPD